MELGTNPDDQIADAYKADAYDADPYSADDDVPYSELVNRQPTRFADDAQAAYDQPDQYNSDYAPYDVPAGELVPTGPADDYPAEEYQEPLSEAYRDEAYGDIAQPDRLTQSVPTADNPTVPAPAAKATEDSDESVEDYMRRLLARMRGVSEGEVSLPTAEVSKPASAVVAKDPSVAQTFGAKAVEPEGEQLSEAGPNRLILTTMCRAAQRLRRIAI